MVSKVLHSSIKQDWETPQADFNEWDKEYNFTLDPCCTTKNCKCPDGIYHDLGEDGLALPWAGRVFMNPPYNKQKLWIPKAVEESRRPGVEFVICLLPARTDTEVFHRYIWAADEGQPHQGVYVEFLKGRLTFGSDHYWASVWETEYIKGKRNALYKKYGKKNAAPFPSMLVCFTWD